MTDDLEPWADDELVQALRAPGTATELADQERYVAAFRDAGGATVRSLPRRAAGRLGAGGTAVVVAVALTSGVAAAYTGHLPDPVQRIAHTVLGAPAPDVDRGHHPEAGRARPDSRSRHAGTPPATTPAVGAPVPSGTASPASAPTPGPGTRSSGPAAPHTVAPSSGSTSSPAGSPSAGGGSAAAMSMSAPTHRVGFGQTITLTGLVTDTTGAALPGHTVVLQTRGRHRWVRVVQTTTDATGLAAATTPATTRSGRYRWKADQGVTSASWLLRMVPTLTVSADVGATSTTLTASAQGSTGGDRIQVVKHVAGHTSLVRRTHVDASGSVDVVVRTPRRRATYAVRLVTTRRHAAAHAEVVVTPPQPAAVSVAGSAARVTSGTSAVISGTVASADGAALPGHTVVLMRRGPGGRWRPVGHAVSDASGRVAIVTPAVSATARFRLRTDHGVRSGTWRIVALPTVRVTGQRNADTVTLAVTTTGARAGDRVVLLRRSGGRLVRMQHAALGPGGGVSFTVPARRLRTTYVVRLPATKVHGGAGASVSVAPTG